MDVVGSGGLTTTINIVNQQFKSSYSPCFSSNFVNGEENSTKYIPSAASQVFENMDDRDK